MRIQTIALLALGFCGIPCSASAALLIQIDKSAQTLTVIRDGATLETWPVSTGKSEHPTPSGSFTAFRMEADHYSKEWDDAPMPHSIFFTKQVTQFTARSTSSGLAPLRATAAYGWPLRTPLYYSRS